jgi:hypothetical protein
MCGYLKRKAKGSRSWKRMWYVLKDKVVYVYKAPEDHVAVESFPVLGYALDTEQEVSFFTFSANFEQPKNGSLTHVHQEVSSLNKND